MYLFRYFCKGDFLLEFWSDLRFFWALFVVIIDHYCLNASHFVLGWLLVVILTDSYLTSLTMSQFSIIHILYFIKLWLNNHWLKHGLFQTCTILISQFWRIIMKKEVTLHFFFFLHLTTLFDCYELPFMQFFFLNYFLMCHHIRNCCNAVV